MTKRNRNSNQKTKVIGETSDKRMPVMEMEVHELAKCPERSCHLEHGWKGGPDRTLSPTAQCR